MKEFSLLQMQKMLTIDDEKIEPLKHHFSNLIDVINTEIPSSRIHSVIVKAQKDSTDVVVYSVGTTRSKGSFVARYNALQDTTSYLTNNLVGLMKDIISDYYDMWPKSRTLFFRFNRSRDAFEIFTSSDMALRTRLFH